MRPSEILSFIRRSLLKRLGIKGSEEWWEVDFIIVFLAGITVLGLVRLLAF